MTTRVIGVDARELLGTTTGVGRYLAELLQRWIQRPDAGSRRLILYSPEPLSPTFTRGCEPTIVAGGRGTSWEQMRLRVRVNEDQPDVFFAPAYTAPLGLSVPFAVTIHDVSFSAHPEWFRWREGTRRRFVTRRAARAASAVLTDSEFSRREIAHYYDVPSERIEVIAPGVTTRKTIRTEARQPIVLYAGTLFNRRGLPDLIAAFALATRDLPLARLVIVGNNRTWPRQDLAAVARTHQVGDRVDLRSYIPDDELSALYARASAFAFLSKYEGFGLTPLEALSAGVPIVVLDTPVAREVYGQAAHYVTTGDIDGTAAALRECLTSPAAASRQLAEAPAILAQYSWDVAASRTLDVLERIAAR
ncbi:MAG: glycosyltransferase family 1 protein [Vicinamibacterales bacterium]